MNTAFLNKLCDKASADGLIPLDSVNKLKECIISERNYQDSIWNENTTSTAGKHTCLEFYTFIQHYLSIAIAKVSTQAEPKASQEAAEVIRKITAMAFAAAERNINIEDFKLPVLEARKNYQRPLVEQLAIINRHLTHGTSPYSCGTNDPEKHDCATVSSIATAGIFALVNTNAYPLRKAESPALDIKKASLKDMFRLLRESFKPFKNKKA